MTKIDYKPISGGRCGYMSINNCWSLSYDGMNVYLLYTNYLTFRFIKSHVFKLPFLTIKDAYEFYVNGNISLCE